jgi:hypothetical protein
MTACISTGAAQCVCPTPAAIPPLTACQAECGGDLSGKWLATAGCLIPLGRVGCDQPIDSFTSASVTGSVKFAAGNATVSTVDTLQTVSHFLPQCTMFETRESSCTALQAQLKEKFPDAACVPNDGCWCTETVPVTNDVTTPYTIKGNEVVLDSTYVPFCVQGDTLTLSDVVYTRATCAGASDCDTDEHCCAHADRTDSLCQVDPCQLGAIGQACLTDDYCSSKRCADHLCAPALKGLADTCVQSSECASNLCCPYFNLGGKACADSKGVADAKCPVLLGDSCSSSVPCVTGTCNLSPDGQTGFCTSTCPSDAAGCGYNSTGQMNFCLLGNNVCQPSCNGDAECMAINPALRCFGYPEERGLCDYSTVGWYDPNPSKP